MGMTPPSTNAVTAAKGAKGSVYTGLTSAFVDNKRYLYAANSAKGRWMYMTPRFTPVFRRTAFR